MGFPWRRSRLPKIPTEVGSDWVTLDYCSAYLPARPGDSAQMLELRKLLAEVVNLAAMTMRQRDAAIMRVQELMLEADRASRTSSARRDYR